MYLKHLALHKHGAQSALLLYWQEESRFCVVPKELLSSDLNSPAPAAVVVLVGHISISTFFLNL